MSQPELVARVLAALQAAGIRFAVTGSVASSLYGEPRVTHSLDVVVDLQAADVATLVRLFPEPDFYLSADAAGEAVATRSMFNLLSPALGEKVDFWVVGDSEFERERFARRRDQDIAGGRFSVFSPEDVILSKLRWADQSGGSEKQFRDALRVYELQYPHIDQAYLDRFARLLGVAGLLDDLRAAAAPLE